MVDIFTLLLAIVSICALAGAAIKIMLTPPKVWDEDWIHMELEELDEDETTGGNKPHIWMD